MEPVFGCERTHLADVDGDVVLIIRPVTQREAELLLTAHPTQFNLLQGTKTP